MSETSVADWRVFNVPNPAPWLTSTRSVSTDERYAHQLVQEDTASREPMLPGLKRFVQEAHEDARRHLRRLAASTLDPLGDCHFEDPASGYPQCLHIETLKGYFGELMAGLVAEHLSPHGTSWYVPAFPFALHDIAFDQLEMWRKEAREPTRIPGQSGDDCLAFVVGRDGRITRCLVCEAKCSAGHRTDLLANAHQDISRPTVRSVRKLIEILKTRGDSTAQQWVPALQCFWLGGPQYGCERCDLVVYVCGQRPVRESSWINPNQPHPDYTGDRRLEVVEIHLSDIIELVFAIYDKGASDEPAG